MQPFPAKRPSTTISATHMGLSFPRLMRWKCPPRITASLSEWRHLRRRSSRSNGAEAPWENCASGGGILRNRGSSTRSNSGPLIHLTHPSIRPSVHPYRPPQAFCVFGGRARRRLLQSRAFVCWWSPLALGKLHNQVLTPQTHTHSLSHESFPLRTPITTFTTISHSSCPRHFTPRGSVARGSCK